MEQKMCFKCGVIKPKELFYKHAQMKDGRLNKCIECTKKDVKNSRVFHGEKISEYEVKRSATPKRKEQASRHQAKWRRENPEKYKAHNAVNNAIRSGKITKPLKCEVCGNVGDLHGHHYDYSAVLDVIWVCEKCHAQIQ